MATSAWLDGATMKGFTCPGISCIMMVGVGVLTRYASNTTRPYTPGICAPTSMAWMSIGLMTPPAIIDRDCVTR
jgi:hypothetical protein